MGVQSDEICVGRAMNVGTFQTIRCNLTLLKHVRFCSLQKYAVIRSVVRTLLTFACLALMVFSIFPILCTYSASANTLSLRVQNARTGIGYPSIQLAINANETMSGDTLLVDEGLYFENVFVNKSLTIIGKNRNTTIVDSGGAFRGFIVASDRANISGFTVQHARWAIYVESKGNCIYGNKLRYNDVGIYLANANNNTVRDNFVESSNMFGEGIDLRNATDSVIRRNLISHSYYGVFMTLADRNIVTENTIINCNTTLSLSVSNNNLIYHNNIIKSLSSAEIFYCTNNWSRGYPNGGNYWSDHNNSDSYGGIFQSDTGGDGITDHAYTIGENNQDAYPLAAMLNVFDVRLRNEKSYSVDIVSNCNVSDFCFNPELGAFLSFNVTGTNSTTGFCRVCIPKTILWADDAWLITLNGETVDHFALRDQESTYLYFELQRSTYKVMIMGTSAMSESPMLAVLPLLTILLAGTIGFSAILVLAGIFMLIIYLKNR